MTMRHAITKLSHFHFITNKTSYKNLIYMGEENGEFTMGLPINDLVYNQKFTNHKDLKLNLI